MIKINGFEHVSWAAPELEPGQRTLALFGIKPTGFEEIHDQDVTANYFEGDGVVSRSSARWGPSRTCANS